MWLKRLIAESQFRSRLRKFKRICRWYNASDIKSGLTILLNGKQVLIGNYNLAVLGRMTLASKGSSNSIDMFQVITTASPKYQAFYREGANLESDNPLIADLRRISEDPVYNCIYSTKLIKTSLLDEACLVLNNEGVRSILKGVREVTLKKVSFPYWNTLGTSLLSIRILQNAQLYQYVQPAVIGTFLRSYRYLDLSERYWQILAGIETEKKSLEELNEVLKTKHPEQIRWIYNNLSDRKLISEVIDHSMFFMGRLKKKTELLDEPAQAVGLAGAFDAAIHPRPYRKTLTIEQIVKEISDAFYSEWDISADGTVTKRGKVELRVWDAFLATVSPPSLRR